MKGRAICVRMERLSPRVRKPWSAFPIAIALAVASGLTAFDEVFAQGTIQFNNRVVGSVDAPVWDMSGTVKLAGDAGRAQLFAAPAGSPSSALTPVQPAVNFRAGKAAGYVISPGEVVIPNMAPGRRAQIELRAWPAPLGSYEAAVAAGVCAGASPSFESVSLGGSVGGAPPLPGPPLVGLVTFAICPEPSIVALGIWRMIALAFRSRRLRLLRARSALPGPPRPSRRRLVTAPPPVARSSPPGGSYAGPDSIRQLLSTAGTAMV